jgi:hypothetical protein
MNKRLIVILFLLHVFALESLPQNIEKDNLLRMIISSYGQATVTIPKPGAREIDDLTRNVSISALKGKSLEIVLSPHTAEWFISKRYNYTILENIDFKGIITASSTKQAMEWSSYPTYTQYDSIMQSFVSLYPSICRLDTIGTTNYGKLVLALKISDNPVTDENEPETFYSSTIHGDETGGFILMLRLADYLLKNYNTSSKVRNLVDNLEIWINPLANPDGTYKNRDTIISPTRYNKYGYDLNRNFPDPVNNDPNKQIETLDMMKFMREHNFVMSANFHAGEEVVNYPWDRWSRRHPDEDWFYYISRKYADTVHIHAVAGYMTFMENGVTDGWDWYTVYGGRQDYVTWELQGREVTIELDDTKRTPSANLNLLWNYNWRSLLGYIENALYGIHGIVTDYVTGVPVPARIFISGHDADSSHVYSDSLSGTFVRLLAPGTWILRFTADGYISKIVSVNVEKEKATNISVEMVPLLNPIDTVTTTDLFIYPNPANEFMKVILPERQIGIISVTIYNSMGIKLADYTEHTFEDNPLYINVQHLQGGVFTIVVTNTATKVSDKARFVIVHRK